MAQRVVAFQAAPRPDQQPEPVIETITHLAGGHRRHPRGRQLDGQRDPVEAAADLHHRGRLIGVGHREARRHTAGRVRRTGSPRQSRFPRRRPARAPATAARRRPPALRGWWPRSFTVADCARMASTRSAAASSTCSQLSNTNSRTLPSSAAATDSLTLLPGCWVMPSTAATASGTAAGSATAASSKNQTPSGNSSASRAATSSRQAGLADPAHPGQRHQPMRLAPPLAPRRPRTRAR